MRARSHADASRLLQKHTLAKSTSGGKVCVAFAMGSVPNEPTMIQYMLNRD